MSKAGQSTFTGISDQADIALLYLLRASKSSDFQRIIIEDKEWEDFTLVFDDRHEDYEVKSYNRPITYGDVKTIIAKEIIKPYREKDILKIVAKRFSNDFKKDSKHIKEALYWWRYLRKKDYLMNPVVKKLVKKGWSENEIAFLLRIELVEFDSIKNIHQQISEFFAYEDDFYYDPLELIKVTSVFFKSIMSKGRKGDVIVRSQFINKLEGIKKHIANYSETFSPDLSLGRQLGNLKRFLRSKKGLLKLNQQKYLSAITKKSRLIFYLADKLTHSKLFHVNDFIFILEKILLKERYVQLTLKILEEKRKQNKVEDGYLLNFVIENYTRLVYDFNYDDALKIVKEIIEKDTQGLFVDKVLGFLKKEIIISFKDKARRKRERRKRGWREHEYVAEILEIFYQRTEDKKAFIDFIFEYFNFTSDDYENVIETHPKIYSLVKDFILLKTSTNFRYVIRKISQQFNFLYSGKYKGCGWMGGGISQVGSSYSITDKGIVRLLFQPLFLEMYKDKSQKAWWFFKQEILEKAKKRATKNNPIYLKRALISILLDRLENKKLSSVDKRASFKYIKNILKMKKGIPDTSEIIFDKLRRRDLKKIGYENIMELVVVDSIKYRRADNPAGYPTNLFVLDTMFILIKNNYTPAKKFFLNLLKEPEFTRRDQWHDSFELLITRSIPENDPDFIVKIFKILNFKEYLEELNNHDIEDKSGLLTGLIIRDWKDGTNRGKKIINALLKQKVPNKKILTFLGGPIRYLAKKNALKTYKLFHPYFINKQIFRNKFKTNSYARQSIVWLADELAKSKHYREAKHIVELCIDDPDPQTHNRDIDFNYHLRVKKGEEQIVITTVRGNMPWVFQKFVLSNNPRLMEYALRKTEILLDLNGNLADRLDYDEPDLYVRLQALVPLAELAHPWRRRKLNEYKKGLGDSVKRLAFDVVDITDKQFESKEQKPKSLLKYLVSAFSYIRDLTVDEAKKILGFFEKYEGTEAHFLFIYFAGFNQDKSFDSTPFKKKLTEMCRKENPFRETISREFWRIADDDNKEKTNNFEKIEAYWKLLFKEYQKEVFNNIYHTLESTLTWPNKYTAHKELLKKAIEKEIENYKIKNQIVQLWEPGKEVFEILKEHNDNDFLEVFYNVIKLLNEKIHYFWIKNWIAIFKSIKPTSKKQKALCIKIQSILRDLYPEYLEN